MLCHFGFTSQKKHTIAHDIVVSMNTYSESADLLWRLCFHPHYHTMINNTSDKNRTKDIDTKKNASAVMDGTPEAIFKSVQVNISIVAK